MKESHGSLKLFSSLIHMDSTGQRQRPVFRAKRRLGPPGGAQLIKEPKIELNRETSKRIPQLYVCGGHIGLCVPTDAGLFGIRVSDKSLILTAEFKDPETQVIVERDGTKYAAVLEQIEGDSLFLRRCYGGSDIFEVRLPTNRLSARTASKPDRVVDDKQQGTLQTLVTAGLVAIATPLAVVALAPPGLAGAAAITAGLATAGSMKIGIGLIAGGSFLAGKFNS